MSEKQLPISSDSLAEDIKTAVDEFRQSDAYREMLREQVSKLFSDTISSAFAWGDISRTLREGLTEALPKNLTDAVDLAMYNELILKEISSYWNGLLVPEQMRNSIKAKIDEMIQDNVIPEHITFTELCEAYAEYKLQYTRDCSLDQVHIVIDDKYDGGVGDDYILLGIDAEDTHTSPHRCDVKLFMKPMADKSNEVMLSEDKHTLYEVFSGHIDINDVLGKSLIPNYHKFQKMMNMLFYCNVPLIMDDYDPYVSLCGED